MLATRLLACVAFVQDDPDEPIVAMTLTVHGVDPDGQGGYEAVVLNPLAGGELTSLAMLASFLSPGVATELVEADWPATEDATRLAPVFRRLKQAAYADARRSTPAR